MISAWMWACGCGRLSLVELDLTSEGKGFPRWAGGERPAPSRCETGLATVGLRLFFLFFFFFFSFLLFPLCLFFLPLLQVQAGSGEVLFIFSLSLAPDHCKQHQRERAKD